MIQSETESYEKIISVESLFSAWERFKEGKSGRKDVLIYESKLEENIFNLNKDLAELTYRHSAYTSFYIHDPKLRHVHKACVRDRLVHQILFDYLNKIYDSKFIYHSYSSRVGKGTHKAVRNLSKAARKVSKNYTKNCWGLKCDVKRFYDTVDQAILVQLVNKDVKDLKIMALIKEVISSFCTENYPGNGMPIGNLTSQVFSNVYLNSLDQYLKHNLKIGFYFRYADDFIILSRDMKSLESLIFKIQEYLQVNLRLSLHPRKVIIRPLKQGLDFLGYTILPAHRNVRTKTKNRMWKKLYKAQNLYNNGKITSELAMQILNSYSAMLSHANTYMLTNDIKNIFTVRT